MATGWVFEESDEDEQGVPRSLGLFSASVQGPDVPDWHRDGPQFAGIDEALGWAREQAEVVIVRYAAPEGEPYEFSAGTREPEEPRPRWPPAQLDLAPRRSPEFAHMDRTERDPEIAWEAIASVLDPGEGTVSGFAAAFGRELETNEQVSGVRWRTGRELGEAACVTFTLDASTVHQAVERAERAAREARDAALRALRVERDEAQEWTVEADAYPAGSSLAKQNVGLGF